MNYKYICKIQVKLLLKECANELNTDELSAVARQTLMIALCKYEQDTEICPSDATDQTALLLFIALISYRISETSQTNPFPHVALT